MPGTRARYGNGGMFMIDMHGTRDFATASRSSRTPGERYWGSCIASATRSKSRGFTSAGPFATIFPGSEREFTSTNPSRPFTGMRTTAPLELMRAASCGRQTSVVSCPASASFTPRSEPYEAPSIRIFLVGMRFLLVRHWPGRLEDSPPGIGACRLARINGYAIRWLIPARRGAVLGCPGLRQQDAPVHRPNVGASAERHGQVKLVANDLEAFRDARLP